MPIDSNLNSSAAISTLIISNVQSGDANSYDCVVTNPCGSVISDSATLAVCPANFNCDSAVDFFDYLDFVDAFSGNSPAADFNQDTVIDFVDAFSAGC